jgi:hypothetical protein
MKFENGALSSRRAPVSSSRHQQRVDELLADHHAGLPVWIRAPKKGPEFFTGLSRSKLYELDSKRLIRSASIREPGQVKGTRLFNLASILAFIEEHEAKMDRQIIDVPFAPHQGAGVQGRDEN